MGAAILAGCWSAQRCGAGVPLVCFHGGGQGGKAIPAAVSIYSRSTWQVPRLLQTILGPSRIYCISKAPLLPAAQVSAPAPDHAPSTCPSTPLAKATLIVALLLQDLRHKLATHSTCQTMCPSTPLAQATLIILALLLHHLRHKLAPMFMAMPSASPTHVRRSLCNISFLLLPSGCANTCPSTCSSTPLAQATLFVALLLQASDPWQLPDHVPKHVPGPSHAYNISIAPAMLAARASGRAYGHAERVAHTFEAEPLQHLILVAPKRLRQHLPQHLSKHAPGPSHKYDMNNAPAILAPQASALLLALPSIAPSQLERTSCSSSLLLLSVICSCTGYFHCVFTFDACIASEHSIPADRRHEARSQLGKGYKEYLSGLD